ncbi:uncharacterized protein [Panulirus ornatus]|uniref:uncharacterized protein isoform X2 n=1 Tax=Panulirus ornatus TaxID=150431 RepID=UPI003A87E7E1
MLVWWQQLAHVPHTADFHSCGKMAATWAVIISLGIAALAAECTAATARPVVARATSLTLIAKNITNESDVSQRPFSHAQPKPQQVPVTPSLSAEQKRVGTPVVAAAAAAAAAVEGGDLDSEARAVDIAGKRNAPRRPQVLRPDDDPEDDDDDDDADDGGNDEYEKGDNELYSEDGEEEYEELPVPLAQTDVGYTRSDGTYVVNDKEGTACVMAYFKSKATIYFSDTKGNYKQYQVSPTDDAKVSGMCDRVGKVSQVDVIWLSYVLSLRFGMDEPTDTWFVSRFSLTYNLSSPDFVNAAPGGREVTVVSMARNYWQTSNDFSFRCLLLHDIELTDEYNNTATLHFDEVRVQAFSTGDTFRTPKHCIHRSHRDEMVPVTVGAVLAGSTLLTIVGYSIFRYFKVKKVQYDTME